MGINLIEYDPKAKSVKLTAHCFTISWLKHIIDKFPEEDHIPIMAYIFYMSCKDTFNPYFNLPEVEKEDHILRDLQPEFDTEDLSIIRAIEKAKELYSTPITRSYDSMAIMMENLNEYIAEAKITDGKEGNVGNVIRLLKDFKSIRESYNELMKEVEEEAKLKARGNTAIAYDQRND